MLQTQVQKEMFHLKKKSWYLEQDVQTFFYIVAFGHPIYPKQ